MSSGKQIMMNSRPADNTTGGGASLGGGGGDDWPKTSIGNYKGVMLCNRPNDFGNQPRVAEYGGEKPFLSRVTADDQVGWNPTKKPMPKMTRKKDPNSVLLKHKKFLRQLEDKKNA
jgi:hypothetical protein